MFMWIYCILATAYFIYFKDYLFFIRDMAYHHILWNTDDVSTFDRDSLDEFLEKNYKPFAIIISKILFLFFAPIFFAYLIIYILKKL